MTDHEIIALFGPAIGMQSVGRLITLAYHLMQVADVPGDVCEFGCYKGHTAALLTALTTKQVWLYDSFAGLPPKAPQDIVNDAVFHAGSNQTDIAAVNRTFTNLRAPTIVQGWFSAVNRLPQNIAFAHLDGDFYDSIMDSLTLIYPGLSHRAVVVIDDYGWDQLQGVKAAADRFLSDKPERITVSKGVGGVPNPQGYFVKQ